MGFLAVNEKDGTADFVGVGEDGKVDQRECRRLVPAAVGVERTLVVAARRLVVGVVVLDELGRIGRQGVDHTAGQGIDAVRPRLRP